MGAPSLMQDDETGSWCCGCVGIVASCQGALSLTWSFTVLISESMALGGTGSFDMCPCQYSMFFFGGVLDRPVITISFCPQHHPLHYRSSLNFDSCSYNRKPG